MRRFLGRNGESWRVWSVLPHVSRVGVPATLSRGWLCFAPEDGAARFRLPMDDAPPAWESLPDDRLELLRRVAELTTSNATQDAHEAPQTPLTSS